ncbi:hypothetical protein Jiend_13840 [Micromonospora endophytica]|nr:hypothetical protein Jiend_13840 [Micromonospora endophytica]
MTREDRAYAGWRDPSHPSQRLGRPYVTSQEIPLHGGNVSTVVRVGDTVRRNVGPWTPSVHALLRHLEYVGFTGAPARWAWTSATVRCCRTWRGSAGTTRWPRTG